MALLQAFLGVAVAYAVYTVLRPLWDVYRYYQQAQRMNLPIKVIPFPPGTFSFIAHILLRRLGLMRPGTKLYALLNMGRPDGRGLHDELGDLYVTVNPMGITLLVADPRVAAHVNTKRADFPKPPNTGALINIYGRNVINADGDVWRFHRRVTGPVFSERIHEDVWQQSIVQSRNMLDSWLKSNETGATSLLAPTPVNDTLRLGFNVITSAAYGCPLNWDESPPYIDLLAKSPSSSSTAPRLSYRDSLSEVNKHLLPLFLTPHWLLRLAPLDSSWGKAWEAYSTFGGYMRGMIEREREIQANGGGVDIQENLLSVLLDAQNGVNEKEDRKMTQAEVMGNAFIFIFAGHETTANTTHYALLRLALHQDVQEVLLKEVDAAYERAAAEGRDQLDYERDFPDATYAMAVMNETLRIHVPTVITNKYAEQDQLVVYSSAEKERKELLIPAGTRISVNGLAIHMSTEVWGDDATEFRPSRWIVPAIDVTTITPRPSSSDTTLNGWESPSKVLHMPKPKPTLRQEILSSTVSSPSPSPLSSTFTDISRSSSPRSVATSSPPSSPEATPDMKMLSASELKKRIDGLTPSSEDFSFPSSTKMTVLKPGRGTFLPFSEGSRMCSGKKFASVEFVAVLYTVLKDHRVELALDEPGWDKERVMKVLKGRKAGALTLTVPEHVPLRFVKRH